MTTLLNKILRDLKDRSLWNIFIKSLIITFGAFSLFVGFSWNLIYKFSFFETEIIEKITDVIGIAIVFIISFAFFPAFITIVMNFFAEDIALAIEKKVYPDLGNPRKVKIIENIKSALFFAFKAIFLNLIILITLLIPPVFPFAFFGINGYLVSREYFDIVALRYTNLKEANKIYSKKSKTNLLTGIALVFLMTLPVINILTPIIAISLSVHIFHDSFDK